MPNTPLGFPNPIIGSNNWGIPTNSGWSLLDQFLRGVKSIPALSVSGNVTVAGSITAGSFVGLDGAFLTESNIVAGTGIVVTISGPNVIISAAVPFSISSFTGGFEVELGASVVNPSFTASYSGSATSAYITNTDGIGSPKVLLTPFTGGTVTGTFSHSSAASVNFTLTASNGSSMPTATVSGVWAPRIFSGVGTSGATGASASGTSAVLVGATGTLPSFQLGEESVGTTFTFNLTGNYFYMLLVNAGHTFNVNGFPATLASTPISFVNDNGVTVSMNLYVGPTFGTGTYTVVITG
jgi:hypothetical protein